MERKNINRGFTQLRVWNNSVELYILTCKLLSKFPYELKKTISNYLLIAHEDRRCIDSSHSISRNIADKLMLNYSLPDWDRRAIFQFSNIAIFQYVGY